MRLTIGRALALAALTTTLLGCGPEQAPEIYVRVVLADGVTAPGEGTLTVAAHKTSRTRESEPLLVEPYTSDLGDVSFPLRVDLQGKEGPVNDPAWTVGAMVMTPDGAGGETRALEGRTDFTFTCAESEFAFHNCYDAHVEVALKPFTP